MENVNLHAYPSMGSFKREQIIKHAEWIVKFAVTIYLKIKLQNVTSARIENLFNFWFNRKLFKRFIYLSCIHANGWFNEKL